MNQVKKRCLDLFCGAGGAAMGYYRAGFEVVGVDNRPQPHYPFEFHQADALEFVAAHGREFDMIHASPPCQAYTLLNNCGKVKESADLVGITRDVLSALNRPFVIENVYGAPLQRAVIVCGASFGLGASGFDLNRHRLFESNIMLLTMPCQHRRGYTIGVYGQGTNNWHRQKFGRCLSRNEMKFAMDIDWMSHHELTQAIPPAYTEFVGRQLIQALARRPMN